MRKELLLTLLPLVGLCFSMAGYGQFRTAKATADADSTINVIGYFCKNDTMVYERSKSEVKLKDGDTIKDRSFYQLHKFYIIVQDSTSDGYTMEFCSGNRKYYGGTVNNPKAKIDSILQTLFDDQKVIFTTDEYGEITGINNWREIRDNVSDQLKPKLDSLYAAIPVLENVTPRKRFESLIKLMIMSEDGILNNYNDLGTLFSLHGRSYEIGTQHVDNSDKDQSVTTITTGYTPDDDANFEGDFNIIASTVLTLSPKDMGGLLAGLTTLFTDSVSDKVNTVFKDSLKGDCTVRQLEDYKYFYNGWPQLMRSQKIVNFMNQGQITTDEIKLTGFHWPNVIITKREEPEKKTI